MDAGVAVVLGAAIGTLGGLSGGWLGAVAQGREQRRAQEAERARRLDDVRREAYGACLLASKQLSAAWWRVADLLRKPTSTESQWQSAADEAHAAWAPFSAAVATVEIVGPSAVADAVRGLRNAMYALDQAGVSWHEAAQAAGTGQLAALDARYVQAVASKRGPAQTFQRFARLALGTEV